MTVTNHVVTRFCQSLWKWPFGMTLFRLGAMTTDLKNPNDYLYRSKIYIIKIKHNINNGYTEI